MEVAIAHKGEVAAWTIHAGDLLDYAKKSKSERSLKGYAVGWKRFVDWCKGYGYKPFAPPHSSHEFLVGLFVADMAKTLSLKVSSIEAYLAGIRHFYAEYGVEVDTRHKEIRKALSGIKREQGTRVARKDPLASESVKRIVGAIDQEAPIGIRDRALILLGFAGAFRRSELVAIDFEHLSFAVEGVSVFIPKSKTDQHGEGRYVDIAFAKDENCCPVRALKEWIAYAGITSGAVFLQVYKGAKVMPQRLSDQSVALVLKKRCKDVGIDGDIAGHSLRAGHVTAAIKKGVSEVWIMRQTGHTSINTLKKYERMNREFVANSSNGLL